MGTYQARNISAAYYAVKEFFITNKLPFSLQRFKKAVNKVKENTGYFGRFEVIRSKGKKYLFDVSHNPDGIKKAMMSMKGTDFKPDVIIFGIMSDNNHTNSLKEIIKHTNNIILTKPDYIRAQEPVILYEYAKILAANKNIMISESVKDSIVIADKLKYKNILIKEVHFSSSQML